MFANLYVHHRAQLKYTTNIHKYSFSRASIYIKTGETASRAEARGQPIPQTTTEEEYAWAPFSANPSRKSFAAGFFPPQAYYTVQENDEGLKKHLVGMQNIKAFTIDLLKLYPRKDLKDNLVNWAEFLDEQVPKQLKAEKKQRESAHERDDNYDDDGTDEEFDLHHMNSIKAVRILSGRTQSNASADSDWETESAEIEISRARFMSMLTAFCEDHNPSALVKVYWYVDTKPWILYYFFFRAWAFEILSIELPFFIFVFGIQRPAI